MTAGSELGQLGGEKVFWRFLLETVITGLCKAWTWTWTSQLTSLWLMVVESSETEACGPSPSLPPCRLIGREAVVVWEQVGPQTVVVPRPGWLPRPWL